DFTGLGDTVQKYVKELHDLLTRKQDEVRERNRQIQEGALAAFNDPRRPQVLPKIEPVPPALNFAPLDNASGTLTESARRYERALGDAQNRLNHNAAVIAAINAKLRDVESQLTDPDGLPNRTWYQHLLYAPGLYTGYSVKTIPGAREAIEQGNY